MDPRLAVIDRRLQGVKDIIAVTGGKGGIGKSLVASTLALQLARQQRKVGLLDLDMTGPCDHLVLGAEDTWPEERQGLVPAQVHGLAFMSVASFTGGRAIPLRGGDVSNALIELLTVTQWGQRDVLVIDMPPGLGDAALDAVRLLGRARYLVVATGSMLVLQTVRLTLELLHRLEAPVAGLVENMAEGEGGTVAGLADQFGHSLLASLPYDPAVETALGRVDELAATAFAAAVDGLARRLVQ